MPTRRNHPADPPRRPRLRKSPEDAARLLQERIELGEELANRINPGEYVPGVFGELEAEYFSWSSYNKELLLSLFDTDEPANEYEPNFGFA